MYVARSRGYSFAAIGRFFGQDHANIMNGVRKFSTYDLTRELEALEKYLDDPSNEPLPVVLQPATANDLQERLARIEQLLETKTVLEKLPIDRTGTTHHFTIQHLDGDEVKVFDAYLTVNTYEDGRVGEFFITAGRDSNAHAMFDVWAISTSRLFQRGEPLEFLQKFVGIRQELAGLTNNKEIHSCTSVVDYVARYILAKYGKRGCENDRRVE
jgi:hypothetical protein